MKKLLLSGLILLSILIDLQAQTLDHLQSLAFRNVGPSRGGRVTTVKGVDTKRGVFYMGATGGGVWKSENYGNSWKNISDGYFATGSIGAIAVFQQKPSILYVGTGSDGIRSNVITGKGIYGSHDSGKTWTHLGLENIGQVGAVEIHPQDSNTLYVAAIGNPFKSTPDRGIYKSTDGGEEWTKVFYLADSVGCSDLELAPNNPDIIYAGMWRAERKPWTIISGARVGGVYKSEDGGKTWEKKTNGLPQGLIGKIDFAVTPTKPERVWALIEAPAGEGGVFLSDDYGESWELVSTKKELLDRPFYYCNIDVNPQNPNSIYVNATRFWHSSDGGKKWTSKRTPHGDNHDMWIHPTDSLMWIQGNDGGANVTLDGGKSWSTQSNQLTAELYQVNVDDQYPYWLYAGQQDNSTIMVPSHPPHNSISGTTGFWKAIGGCETGPAVPKPGNPNIVYSNCKGRFGVFNQMTGQEMQYYVGAGNMYGHNPKDLTYRFQRVSPIHVSPHNPDIVYHCSQFVHKTMDDGKTWERISPDLTAFRSDRQVLSGTPITRDITGEEFYSTIYTIQESPLEPGVIWVGANDGPVHVTRDGGKNWEEVTPEGLPPEGRVQTIDVSAHKPGKAYMATYRYLLGDFKPYIYRTENYGKSWKLLTNGKNGIPIDFPTRVIREDVTVPGLLFAGTEFGIFVSMDDGLTWSSFQQNLPVVPITDMKIYENDLVLSTMGRSFWILDEIHPIRQIATSAVSEHLDIIVPNEAIRNRSRAPNDPNGIQYQTAGLVTDIWIGDELKGKYKLEIRKGDQVVRTFSGQIDSLHKKQDKITFKTKTDPGKLQPGFNRFTWNLRKKGSSTSRFSSGPMVTPGDYVMKLSVGEESIQQSFKVKMDPRVSEAGITMQDLIEQEKIIGNLTQLIADTRKLKKQVGEKMKDVEKWEPKQKKKQGLKAAYLVNLTKASSLLNTAEGRYQTPQLIDQLNYLYNMLNRADQRPGKDAYDRLDWLKKEFNKVQMLNQNVPKLSSKDLKSQRA